MHSEARKVEQNFDVVGKDIEGALKWTEQTLASSVMQSHRLNPDGLKNGDVIVMGGNLLKGGYHYYIVLKSYDGWRKWDYTDGGVNYHGVVRLWSEARTCPLTDATCYVQHGITGGDFSFHDIQGHAEHLRTRGFSASEYRWGGHNCLKFTNKMMCLLRKQARSKARANRASTTVRKVN